MTIIIFYKLGIFTKKCIFNSYFNKLAIANMHVVQYFSPFMDQNFHQNWMKQTPSIIFKHFFTKLREIFDN